MYTNRMDYYLIFYLSSQLLCKRELGQDSGQFTFSIVDYMLNLLLLTPERSITVSTHSDLVHAGSRDFW